MTSRGWTLQDEFENAGWVLRRGYYIWFCVFVVATLAAVGLPGLAALGLFGADTDRIIAGCGALAVALIQAIKPHEYATAYDIALQRVWKARVLFVGGSLDAGAASREIGEAIDLTTFRYVVASHSRKRLKPPVDK